jgi:chromosome segregation ATPase
VKLSDAMQLMEWLQPATKAIQTHQQLPAPPTLTRSEVSIWIETIRGLAESRRESDQGSTRLTAEIRDRETHVRRLSEELRTSMDEMKATQTTAQALQLDIATYQETMAKVAELAGEVIKQEDQMRVAAGELLQEGSPFEKFANSVKEIAQALKAVVKPAP